MTIIQKSMLRKLACLVMLFATANAAAEKVVVVPMDAGDSVSGVVTRTAQFTFPGLNNGSGLYLSGTAVCNPGEHVLGGGHGLSTVASSDGQPNVIVIDNRPAAANGDVVANGGTAQGWYLRARQSSTFVATTVTIYVQCLVL